MEFNSVVEWLIQSGALVALFSFAWKYLKPYLDDKKAHASTEQSKAWWSLLETVADTSVSSLVSSKQPGAQKFDSAVEKTITAMNKQGYQVTTETAQTAVQAAYEKSPLTDSKQTTSTVTVGPSGLTTTIKPADGTATAIDPKED